MVQEINKKVLINNFAKNRPLSSLSHPVLLCCENVKAWSIIMWHIF